MAEHGADYHRGEMDINEHIQTFSGFLKLSKWGSLYLAAFLLMVTLWFCTTAGFLAGFITAIVVIVLGTLLLRDKHTA